MMRSLVLALSLAALACAQQDFTQRGYIETRAILFPQTGSNDSAHAVGDTLFRYEASRAILPGLRVYSSFDARYDTHRQAERTWRLDSDDRHLLRPAFSLRRASVVYNKGKFTTEIGRQLIRWGKADILNPTDRFAPRDFLTVVDNDFLGIPAARLTYESGGTTVEAVWQVRIVPSRTPLVNQRWTIIPEEIRGVPIADYGSRFPGGGAYGLRINHIGRGYDASVSAYEGWNHLPLLDARFEPELQRIGIQRFYAHMRSVGADFAVPLRWLTVKGEAAWFASRTRQADEYALYVIQLERQSGEWMFVGGYAGEAVTKRRSPFQFAPDRGLTKAFLGRASYTIDANRSVAFETALRQNGRGVWVKAEYSQAYGNHWRATGGITLIQGKADDFLGQYHRNSHAMLALRYSF